MQQGDVMAKLQKVEKPKVIYWFGMEPNTSWFPVPDQVDVAQDENGDFFCIFDFGVHGESYRYGDYKGFSAVQELSGKPPVELLRVEFFPDVDTACVVHEVQPSRFTNQAATMRIITLDRAGKIIQTIGAPSLEIGKRLGLTSRGELVIDNRIPSAAFRFA